MGSSATRPRDERTPTSGCQLGNSSSNPKAAEGEYRGASRPPVAPSKSRLCLTGEGRRSNRLGGKIGVRPSPGAPVYLFVYSTRQRRRGKLGATRATQPAGSRLGRRASLAPIGRGHVGAGLKSSAAAESRPPVGLVSTGAGRGFLRPLFAPKGAAGSLGCPACQPATI